MAAAQPRPGLTAVVVGGGISGLLSARELARAGVSTTVLEASGEWGGCVGRHVVGGLTLDSGAESFATRSPAVADLAAELGLAAGIVAPDPRGAWVQLPGGPRELPRTGVLGIPASPWDPEVRRSLGTWGSLRASLDALLPASFGTGGEEMSISALVRARMGRRVLERLVAPVVGGVHSADPAGLDVDLVAPGLRAGVRRHGSLAAAVAALRGGAPGAPSGGGAAAAAAPLPNAEPLRGAEPLRNAEPLRKAGSAVAGLRGGMHTLVAALVADLRGRGVTLCSGTRADAVERTGAGWRVRSQGRYYDAELLVVAVEGPAAVGLLSEALPGLAGQRPAAGPDVSLVTLVVDLPELDAAPRGTGILVAPQSPGIAAKALTHATAKWHWLAGRAGPGTHVLRLSYGRAAGSGAGPATEPQTDGGLLNAALRDASALLGVPVPADAVRAWDVVRWSGALPYASLGHKRRIAEVRNVCATDGTVAVVGGWLAGNGLAAIVEDTPRTLRTLLR